MLSVGTKIQRPLAHQSRKHAHNGGRTGRPSGYSKVPVLLSHLISSHLISCHGIPSRLISHQVRLVDVDELGQCPHEWLVVLHAPCSVHQHGVHVRAVGLADGLAGHGCGVPLVAALKQGDLRGESGRDGESGEGNGGRRRVSWCETFPGEGNAVGLANGITSNGSTP